MKNKVMDELRQLNISNVIFLTFIIISITGIVANNIEKESIKSRNVKNPSTSHYIRVGIFFVSLLIYIYFVYRSYKNSKENENNVTFQETFLNNLNLLATILFLIGGILILYLELKDEEEEEIAIV